MREIVGEAKIAKGQYWSKTLTLVRGCTPVSEGCAHCWSAAMASRFPWGNGFAEGGKWTGKVEPNWKALKWLEERAKSKRVLKPQVFCIWNDFFHSVISGSGWDFQKQCFLTMSECSQDIFLILTKRPENIPLYHGWIGTTDNIWLGVSVESQEHVDRIQTLIAAWPGKKFVSIEPCLGNINLMEDGFATLARLDWVLLGGETGPHARPLRPDWVQPVRNQCVEAGVPFFFKHWGEYISRQEQNEANDKFVWCCKRIGKKKAGRLLEGRTWDEMPEVEP